MEQIVSFQSEGKEIFGILHVPDQPIRQMKVGIIVVRNRTGPHWVFVQAARLWCNEGFHVLREDFPGIGDSGGEYRYRYIDDFPMHTLPNAVRYFKEHGKMDKIIIVGMCAGARTTLNSSVASPDVQHLVLLAMPFSDVSPDSPDEASSQKIARISSYNAKRYLISYLKLLAKPKEWKRFLSRQCQFSFSFWIMLMNSLLKRNKNRLFQERVHISLRTFFERQGHILFVYGGGDLGTPDFMEEFEFLKSAIPEVELLSEVHLIEGANHVFSRVEWKTDAIKCVTAWLNRQFPI